MEKRHRFTVPAWDGGAPLPDPEQSRHNAFIESEAGRFLGHGTDRIVYGFGDGCVVKVPRHDGGKGVNETEARRCERGVPFPTAGCRMAGCGRLVMKRVKPVDPCDWDRLPRWTEGVGAHQVGWRRGRLLAYDYGSEISADLMKEA